jgi:hypothetical protein
MKLEPEAAYAVIADIRQWRADRLERWRSGRLQEQGKKTQ